MITAPTPTARVTVRKHFSTSILLLARAYAPILAAKPHTVLVDTRMAAQADGPKLGPANLVTQVYDAVETDQYEVIGDELTAQVKQAISGPVQALYPELRETDHAAVAVTE